jgi:two-component system response regulator TctD
LHEEIGVEGEISKGSRFEGLHLVGDAQLWGNPALALADRRRLALYRTVGLDGSGPECRNVRILVVEDDPDLGDALVQRLRREGHAVDWEQNGEAADDILQYQQYEVILLDIGLPGMDGFAILRALRRRGSRTPVLMLTARSEIRDRVGALDVGADDYLSKPFDFREFDARCRALLRRSQGSASNITRVGRLTFDRANKVAQIGDTQLRLPNRELRLLEIFLANVGRVVSKDQIASQLFEFDDEAGPNAIELYVCRLRQKLDPALTIRTIRRLGYIAEAVDDGDP